MPEPDDPLEIFYRNNPGLRPGAPAGGVAGRILSGASPTASTTPRTPAANPTAGPPPPPPGAVVVSPGRAVGNNGLTTFMLNAQTNAWEPSAYPPSAADKAAAGIGGTTPRVDYTQQKAQTQVQQGGSPTLPSGAYQIAATRAVDRSGLTVWTKDPATGNWTNAGFPPNAADKQAAMRVAQTQRSSDGGGTPTTPGVTGPTSTPGAPSLVANPLQGNQAPLLSSFSNFTTPGREISGDNRRTMYTGREMNTLQTSRVNPNGPQIPAFGVSGLRPSSATGNNYNFTPQSQAPAYAQFPNTPFSVPDTYRAGPSGFSIGGSPIAGVADSGAFRAFDIPFGVTGPSLTGPGGAGVMTLAGPQTVNISNADKSIGFGFNPTMFGPTYGRDLSSDAATRAVEAAMLIDQQNKLGPAGALSYLTTVDPGSYTGQPGLYGNPQLPGGGVYTDYGSMIFGGFGEGGYGGGDSIAFGSMAGGGTATVKPRMQMRLMGPMMMARGGGAAVRPLAGRDTSGPKSIVTTEPLALVGMMTGMMHGMVGEDGTGDGRPDAERLTFPTPNTMKVTPLNRPALTGPMHMMPGGRMMMGPAMATGGRVTYKNAVTGAVGDYNPDTDFPEGNLADWTPYTPPVEEPTPTIDLSPAPVPAPTPTAVPPSANGLFVPIDNGGVDLTEPGSLVPIDPGGIYTATMSPTPPADPLAGYNPFDASILAPWLQRAGDLAWREHQRQVIDEPRRRAAGLIANSATGIRVEGDEPTAALPPGMFYDPSGQVTRAISDILGAQGNLRALGPEEDVAPAYEQVTSIGNALDDIARIRQLEDARVAAVAQATTEQAAVSNEAARLAAELMAAQNALVPLVYASGPNVYPLQRPAPGVVEALQQKVIELSNAYQRAQQAATSAVSGVEGDVKLSTIDAQIASILSRLPIDANGVYKSEAALRTDLARERQKIDLNDKRILLKNEVANLAKIGVPKLNGPILPVQAAA